MGMWVCKILIYVLSIEKKSKEHKNTFNHRTRTLYTNRYLLRYNKTKSIYVFNQQYLNISYDNVFPYGTFK